MTKRPDAQAAEAKQDRFLREATRQYEEGHVDEPLWTRALAQANGDKDAAVAIYLRARATALRVLDRDLRTDRRPQPAAVATRPAVPETTTADIAGADASPRRVRQVGVASGRYWMIGAAALVPVAGIVWFAVAHLGGSAGGKAQTVQTPPRAAVAAPAPAPVAKPAAAASLVQPAVAGAAPKGAAPDFLKKIDDLADAGNWNLFVLYAVEWTRQEPANAAAWDRLRTGYVNMRQYDDALAAAKRAAELAPRDARMWRALGNVQLEVEDGPGALRSFGQAVALDAQDVESLKQVGVLHARVGRTSEAKAAFDAALALRPDDANALCLRSALMQPAVPVKDTQVVGRPAKPFDDRCRNVVASSARN